MARMARKRHLRHGAFERTNRSKHLRAFLSERNEALKETGSTYAFTATEPEAGAAATGTLTLTDNAGDTETVTIGDRTYTFVTALTEPAEADEVLIGADAGESLDNLVAAINGDEGEGTAYGEGTEAHADVTAARGEGDTMVVTARELGTDGNSIASTETMADGSFGAATLGGGKDVVAATASLGSTDHGLEPGEGPFLATTTDELPEGLSETQFYWVLDVPDENTLTLTTRRGSRVAVVPTSKGTGDHSLVKADTVPAIYEYLRQNAPEVVRDADDVDAL